MRIAAAQYNHETNSFSVIKVTAEVMQLCKHDGTNFFQLYTGIHNSFGGLIAAADALDITLIPTLFASFRPCGPAVKAVYETYRDEMVDGLWQEQFKAPLDAIVLLAHGAGIADGYDDVEGDILQHLRDRFGYEIPIGLALDLHANISEEMFNLSTFMVGCKEYPHIDYYETAYRLMQLLHMQTTHGKALRKLQMRIPSAAGCTLSGPGLKIKNLCNHLQNENPEILDISVFHGFNAGNVHFAGVSITVTAISQKLADSVADQIATYVLSLENEFIVPIYTPKEAIKMGQAGGYPAVINESTDNPGSGHPGDGTILLRQMLEENIPNSVYIGIFDPQVAAEAAALGVGKEISCLLGAKIDNKHGTPISLKRAKILSVSDGEFICESMIFLGAKIELGTTVLLQIDNVKVVITSIRCQNYDDGPLRTVGIKWQDCSIIGLKSLQHFRAWWTDKAKNIIPINAPADKQYQ